MDRKRKRSFLHVGRSVCDIKEKLRFSNRLNSTLPFLSIPYVPHQSIKSLQTADVPGRDSNRRPAIQPFE